MESLQTGWLLLGVGSGEESGQAVAVKRKKKIFLKNEFFFFFFLSLPQEQRR